MAYLLVFLGGGIGCLLRHIVNQTSAAYLGASFPWGTLSVNVVGSLAMGVLTGWITARGATGQPMHLFLATGILGGFTTFSAFSLDIVQLWERGQTTAAVLYALSTLTTAIIAVLAGMSLIRAL